MKYTGPLYAKMPGTRKYVKLREDSEYVDNLETKLAEARAEIVAIQGQNLNRASASLWAIMRHAFMDGTFKGYEHGTEEKLRIQYFNEWCQKNYPEAVDAAIKREELIEQLCKGLEAVIRVADRDTDEFALAKSALSAAKRRDQ